MRNKAWLTRQLAPLGWRSGLFLLILCIGLTACKTPDAGQVVETPGAVIYQDNFSDPESGWNRVSENTGSADYDDGVYRIQVNVANTDIWAIPGQNFQDVRVEVDVFKAGGDRNNRFGVICRVNQATNFYTFVISSDGYYGIGKVKGLSYELLGMESLWRSDKIPAGAGFIHLRADCVGDELTLYVDDVLIYQVHDAEFISGDVGLTAGSYDNPLVDIRFDNFMVYLP